MQQFIINTEESAVLQVRFLSKKNETIKTWENEPLNWSSSNEEIFKVVSSNFDGVNQNVIIQASSSGLANLVSVGLFKDESTEKTYQFSGVCEIKVVQPKVDSAYFTMSHKFLTP